MGRGTDVIDKTGRVKRRAQIVDIVEEISILRENLEGSVNGIDEELVHLSDGSTFPLAEGDPANILHGLALIETIEPQRDGTFLVRFRDGEEALVDLSENSIALASGDDSPIHIAGALYSALAQRALNLPANVRPDISPEYKKLAEAYANFQDSPGDIESLKALALAARDCGADVLPDELSVNAPDFLKRLHPSEEEETSQMDKLAQRWPDVHAGIQKILAGPTPELATSALLYQVNEDGTPKGLSPELAEERRNAADVLAGGEPGDGSGAHLIPRKKADVEQDPETGKIISKGEYYFGPQEQEHFALLRNHMNMNGRFVVMAGPPGTGKDTLAREFAAQAGLPFKQFNIGPDYDIEQALSGDVVGTETVYREEWVKERDDQGKVVLDSDGEPKMRKERVPVGVAPITKTQDGELARWLQQPSVIVIDEPEGMEAQMVRLHSIAGDDVDSADNRFVTVNSLTGEEKPVHPDCFLFLAYNPGEGDQRFRPALHDRGLNLSFDYYDADVEAEILATEVTNIMRSLPVDNHALQKDWTAEELKPMAEVFVAARNAHMTNPADFPGEIGRRGTARAFAQMLLLGYEGHDEPVDTAFATMRWLTRQSGEVDVTQRDKQIRDSISADQHLRLNDIAKAARALNPAAKDDEEDDS